MIPFFPATFIPLHHYFLEALNLMFDHLATGASLPESQVVRPVPRATAGEELDQANLPPIASDAAEGDEIRFEDAQVRIPD